MRVKVNIRRLQHPDTLTFAFWVSNISHDETPRVLFYSYVMDDAWLPCNPWDASLTPLIKTIDDAGS